MSDATTTFPIITAAAKALSTSVVEELQVLQDNGVTAVAPNESPLFYGISAACTILADLLKAAAVTSMGGADSPLWADKYRQEVIMALQTFVISAIPGSNKNPGRITAHAAVLAASLQTFRWEIELGKLDKDAATESINKMIDGQIAALGVSVMLPMLHGLSDDCLDEEVRDSMFDSFDEPVAQAVKDFIARWKPIIDAKRTQSQGTPAR